MCLTESISPFSRVVDAQVVLVVLHTLGSLYRVVPVPGPDSAAVPTQLPDQYPKHSRSLFLELYLRL